MEMVEYLVVELLLNNKVSEREETEMRGESE